MTTYRFVTLDGPPEFFDADDCRLENSEMLTREDDNKDEPVMSWMFYIDGRIVYELPVRAVQEEPVPVKAGKKAKE